MKSFPILIGIALACLPLTGCTPAPELPFSEAAVRREVETRLEEYFRDMEAEGLLAEFEYLDSSDQFFWIPPGYGSALDYDSIRNLLLSNAGLMREIHYRWEELKVFPLSRDLASFHGKLRGHLVDTSGQTFEQYQIESGLAIRRPDGWKLLSGQSREVEE